MKIRYSALLILFVTISILLNAQSSTVQFGQNRVQFHGFEWSFYETDHFNVYFYIGNQDIGKFVILDAEKELKELSNMLDIQVKSKIDILVYTDITDANMSNVGIYQEENNMGGNVKIIANKILVYFDGNHNHLREQIRRGILSIYMQRISQGTNFQEVMQNVVSPNLPEWFSEGLVQYMASNWTATDDNLFKTAIEKKQYVKFKKLEGERWIFFGKAFWNYVMIHYGEEAISNLLYIARVNPKNLNGAFSYAFNNSMNEMLNRSMKYYQERYAPINDNSELLPKSELLSVKTKKQVHYYGLEANDNGRFIAYCSNEYGRKKLYVYDTKEKKTRVIFRLGHRTQTQLSDASYPLIAWEPGGNALSFIYEKRDKIKLGNYQNSTHKFTRKPITKFQKIYAMNYGSDKGTLLFSALQKGQCDIFSYDIKTTNVLQLTNDFWDDLDPAFIRTQAYQGIVFKSNRRSDTIRTEKLEKELPLGPFNLFFYSPIYTPNFYAQITQLPSWSNCNAIENYNDSVFSFISDESGIANRYIAYFERTFWYTAQQIYYTDTFENFSSYIQIHEGDIIDSFLDMSSIRIDSSRTFPVYKLIGKTMPVSNMSNAILDQRIIQETAKTLHWHFDGIKYRLYNSDIDLSNAAIKPISTYTLQRKKGISDSLQVINSSSDIIVLNNVDTVETFYVNDSESVSNNKIATQRFQTDFDDMPSTDQIDSVIRFNTLTQLSYNNIQNSMRGGKFVFSKQRPYIVKMMTDKLAAQLDNTLLITRYAVFNPQNPSPNIPALGGLFKLGVVDLMENYRITGGFRLPSNLSGTEYFLSYENIKKRLDVKYTYYRSSRPVKTDNAQVPFDTIVVSPADLPFEYRIKTNYAEVQMKYALDVRQSIRMGIAYRNDKYVYRAKSETTLNLNNYQTNWISLKVDYVFDNTFRLGTNLLRGTRFKLFTEWHKEIPMTDTRITSSFNMKLPRWNDAYFGIIGVDIRHYEKLYKNIILATRFSWSTSVGTRKMLYFLGGVDGGIAPQFNNSIPINNQYKYAFQSIATDLRGHNQNIRNGNTYMLLNVELRIPVFSSLFNINSRSELIRNFQLVGFTDVGSAWEGLNPFSSNNPLFKTQVRNPITSPVTVTIYQQKNPIVSGFGAGLRTTIFGYFIRADLAWGYDGIRVSGPHPHISFNLDF